MPNSRATWTAVSEMKTCWTQCEHPAVRSSVARPVSSASPVPPLAIEERARNEEGHAQENADPESHCCEAIRIRLRPQSAYPNADGVFHSVLVLVAMAGAR